MTKKLVGMLLGLAIILSSTAALAVPADTLTYKTLLKNDDFYLALKTDSIVWTTQPGGDLVLSLTARWAYARPERAARYYPAARQGVYWRISKVASQYDRVTGFVKLMELETVLYDAGGEAIRVIKNPNTAAWRILTPTDPDYESFDRILGYIYDTAN